MEVVVTTGAIKRAKLQSQCHHQHQHLLNFNQTINLSVSDQMHPVSILREKNKKKYTYIPEINEKCARGDANAARWL